MRCTNRWFIVSLITGLAPSLLAYPSAAQSQVSSDPPRPRPSASAAPLVMKLLTVDMRVGADGLYTQRVHWELTPANDSAASRAGQQAVSYSAALEDVQIIEAYTFKPEFPGQFMSFDMFPRAIAWNELRERSVTPRGFPLTVEAHGVEFQRVMGQNEVTYAWHYDREPRLFASSFKSYADLGRAYAEPLAPRLP